MKLKVPIVMYHSVGVSNPCWIWNHLTVPYDLFLDHIRFLSKMGFHSINLIDYYRHIHHGDPLPVNPIILTFDDGYLDNWVFAYPILKKFGFKGTVFVNPEFVDPMDTPRSTLEDVWLNKLSLHDLQPYGFLSWAEMRRMIEGGVMDIQSHAMTHTWYFSGPEIADFKRPGDQHVWMDWNENTDKKWQYLIANETADNQHFGSPVYEHGKSLEVRRYFPDKRLSEHLEDYVADRGVAFFDAANWREDLLKVADVFLAQNPPRDFYESEQEHYSRLHWELVESKRILEAKLSKAVDFLCWPGGGYDHDSIKIAKKNYLGSTISSCEKKGNAPRPVDGHLRIKRIGCPYIERNGKIEYTSGRYLYHFLREYQGAFPHRTIRRGLKLVKLLSRHGQQRSPDFI